jgi:beta-glucosidase
MFSVSVDVTNTGSRKGDEVVQLYLKDDVSSVTTYEYDLRGFERISLNPGEKKTVHLYPPPGRPGPAG